MRTRTNAASVFRLEYPRSRAGLVESWRDFDRVGAGEQGETYNINADLVAGQLAEALGAEKLILLTDVDGVKDKKGELLSTLKINQARKLIQEGVVAEGMIPKVECCIEALKGGVGKTHIIDGRVKHAVLLEIFTKEGVGTEVVRK